jgi:micrococcal nuclease
MEGAPYFYLAYVNRVIDGDTIQVTVDVGFRIKMEMRLRLLGIDTPDLRPRTGTDEEKEAEKKAAKRSKEHVSDCIFQKDVRIRTHKADSFGRYLADVWFDLPQGGEVHLNQDLLDRGLAEVYKK